MIGDGRPLAIPQMGGEEGLIGRRARALDSAPLRLIGAATKLGWVEKLALRLARDPIHRARPDLAGALEGDGNGLQKAIAIAHVERSSGGEDGVKLGVGKAERRMAAALICAKLAMMYAGHSAPVSAGAFSFQAARAASAAHTDSTCSTASAASMASSTASPSRPHPWTNGQVERSIAGGCGARALLLCTQCFCA
jgi:hypothetical protein